MKCPIDGSQLTIADRNGVEIDFFPNCRGVWLHRGELDKIIDRAGNLSGQIRETRQRTGAASPHPKQKRGRKMGGFLEDIFDF